MGFSLIPDRVFSSVAEIRPEWLTARGITLLLADLDNTLVRYGPGDPPYLGHAGKPGTAGFEQAMARMGRTAGQTAMVGDQIFTDILGARRMGILALLVEPIQLAGNPGRYLRYAVEQPFRALGKRRSR